MDYEDYVIGKYVKVYSEILGEERTILVRLPGGYDESEKRYPVFYLLDGEHESLFANAVSSIEFPRDDRNAMSMILVAVVNTDRSRDMFPVKVDNFPTSGGASSFLKFMADELKPFVDRSYRTAQCDILFGASNSGLFVVYAILERPDAFDAYIASSPMIGWCGDFIFKLAEKRFSESSSMDRFLYMTYGLPDSSHVTSFVPEFIKIIESQAPDDFKWELKFVEEGGHVPYASIYDGLNALTDRARATLVR